MYQPQPQPSPPASPASLYAPVPVRPSPHAPLGSTGSGSGTSASAPLWAAFSRANGRRRASDADSLTSAEGSVASSGADSTGALVGLGMRQQQQQQQRRGQQGPRDDMVEVRPASLFDLQELDRSGL